MKSKCHLIVNHKRLVKSPQLSSSKGRNFKKIFEKLRYFYSADLFFCVVVTIIHRRNLTFSDLTEAVRLIISK